MIADKIAARGVELAALRHDLAAANWRMTITDEIDLEMGQLVRDQLLIRLLDMRSKPSDEVWIAVEKFLGEKIE